MSTCCPDKVVDSNASISNTIEYLRLMYNHLIDEEKIFLRKTDDTEGHPDPDPVTSLILPLKTKECHFAQRAHESNHQYLLVDRNGCRQKCHDHECAHKEHKFIEAAHFPPHVTKELVKVNILRTDAVSRSDKGKEKAIADAESESNVNKGKRKIAILRDNPPLSGKKFFLASMISPEGRQKHPVHAFKLHDMCETEEEGRQLAELYREMDPDFDVLLGTVGKWCPWVFDPLEINNVEYANKELTDLIKSHRTNRLKMDEYWHKEHEMNLNEIRKGNTVEGQMEMANRKEPPEALYFKIRQLELTIKRRKDELDDLQERFHTEYTKVERNRAKKTNLPLSEPPPMQYTLLGSAPEEVERERRFHAP